MHANSIENPSPSSFPQKTLSSYGPIIDMDHSKKVTPLESLIHYSLRYISTAMIGLSSLITLICVCVIIGNSAKTSSHYARLLLLVTILPIISDISLHFVLDPVPLLPLLCLYRWQPIIPLPGSATTYYIFWVETIAGNACAYAACFMHRHQVVVPPGLPGKFSLRSRYLFLGSLMAITCLYAPILAIAERAENETTIILSNKTSGFTESELRRVNCYDAGLSMVFVGHSFIAFTISIVFLIALTIHIFILLKDTVRHSMSQKTRGYHLIMTKALATQATVAFVFLLVPLILFLYFLTVASVHSFMHSATVLGTTPIYRKALSDSIFKKIVASIMVAPRETTKTSNTR